MTNKTFMDESQLTSQLRGGGAREQEEEDKYMYTHTCVYTYEGMSQLSVEFFNHMGRGNLGKIMVNPSKKKSKYEEIGIK